MLLIFKMLQLIKVVNECFNILDRALQMSEHVMYKNFRKTLPEKRQETKPINKLSKTDLDRASEVKL